MSQAYPRVLGHISLTVEDIDEAFEWYQDVLGFTPVMEPDTVVAGEGHFGKLAADAVGYDFGEMQIAHLATGNHVGVELFELRPPRGRVTPTRPRRGCHTSVSRTPTSRGWSRPSSTPAENS